MEDLSLEIFPCKRLFSINSVMKFTHLKGTQEKKKNYFTTVTTVASLITEAEHTLHQI